MLIVKDFEKLEKHGFKKLNNWEDGAIWELILANEDDESCISLLVNPHATVHAENEMFVYAYSNDEAEMDMCTKIDIVFEMIVDGTIEYVKENKNG